MALNKHAVVRNYFVLPCCILLLNVVVGLVSYKAKVIDDPLLRTGAIMLMVLFGGSVIGFVAAPAIEAVLAKLHRSSVRRMGGLGELGFILVLAAVVFWLYYRMYIMGPEYLLPADWRNSWHRH
jgi:hypothetical protein